MWRGRSVARRFVSPDGMTILVGRTAADNDVLTLKLGSQADFWLHAAGVSGSHVVVRNPEHLDRMPRPTRDLAAALAALHSRARRGGSVAVHVARLKDISKPRGAPKGQVSLGRSATVTARPADAEDAEEVPA